MYVRRITLLSVFFTFIYKKINMNGLENSYRYNDAVDRHYGNTAESELLLFFSTTTPAIFRNLFFSITKNIF